MRGHIRKRGNSYELRIYLGRDPKTHVERRKCYTHPTRRQAEAHLNQLLVQIQAGGGIPPSRLLTGDFLQQWLDDYAAGAVTQKTLNNYRDTVRVHLTPGIGHIPIARLSPQAIQGYLSEKLREGRLSPTSVQYQYGILREALGYAVRWGLLMRNPCEFVDTPRRRNRETQVLDEEQVRLFLAEAKRSSPYSLLYRTALLTGMRQGELLGLRWKDVDFTSEVISVQQSLCRVDREIVFKEPKTQKGRRTVALPPLLAEEIRTARGDAPDHCLVFCQANGKPLHGHNITQRDLRVVLKRAKVPRIRFHDLRHCHATYLLRQGVHPKVVQERLGHSTPAITLGIYSHVLPGMQEEAAKRLETHLLGRQS